MTALLQVSKSERCCEELVHTYRRFVSLPDGGAEALALWIVFTYALEAFDVAPILALCSPLKRCGKTTTEEVTHRAGQATARRRQHHGRGPLPHRRALRPHPHRG